MGWRRLFLSEMAITQIEKPHNNFKMFLLDIGIYTCVSTRFAAQLLSSAVQVSQLTLFVEKDSGIDRIE